MYFPHYKLHNNKTHTKLYLMHTNALEDIIKDLKDELLHYNFAIHRKALQYWDILLAR